MNTIKILCIMAIASLLGACSSGSDEIKMISEKAKTETIDYLKDKHDKMHHERIEKGVTQVASLWFPEDGTEEEFIQYCKEQFIGDEDKRKQLFESLSRNFEKIWGHSNQLSLELNKPLHLDIGEIQDVDMVFAAYSAGAHFFDDFYKNKIAFTTMLNFPFYSLKEKSDNAESWSRTDWAYARMGDVFTSRVPAAIAQEISRISTQSDGYISDYNIRMGSLLDKDGNTLFPEGMSLITHWGLRDEIKSNYANPEGQPKQEMIYQVMQRIINQDIPLQVINNSDLQWNPYVNEVFNSGEKVDFDHEPNTRYQYLLNNFHAIRKADAYTPTYPTYNERAFDESLELSMDEVETLFTELVSSPLLKEVGAMVSERLGRDLRPYDIWYDGFKARSSISEDYLNSKTQGLYPNALAFEKNLPDILRKLGYDEDRAQSIASKITVEASRGAGHAWGAEMRTQLSHLRTRVGVEGMDYKGYNIAMHELGHNVEQTISLHDVDYYVMNGVPNTAFTEALAFIYQSRDLDVLGITNNEPMVEYLNTLDKFWGTYEIMGVSLVDMAVWKWMYEHPDATAEELKIATIDVANRVWNDYFYPVYGVKDQPILAIYSHMIAYPLYLSAYPLGRLIEFQIENHIKGQNLAKETDRMFMAGRLIPQEWMRNAVGEPLSNQPMLEAVEVALKALK